MARSLPHQRGLSQSADQHTSRRHTGTPLGRGFCESSRLWRCHPQTASCRVIPTLWATTPNVGFVGIDGGGEHYLPFHQPHSDEFIPDAIHQQILLIASPVALPPPIRLAPLHPTTMGDALHVLFCWNQWWGRVIGGVLPQQIKSFFYTQQSTGL